MTTLSTILTVVFLLVTAAIFILPLDKLLEEEAEDNDEIGTKNKKYSASTNSHTFGQVDIE